MQDLIHNTRVKRIILINPFIDNFGTILKGKFLGTILFLGLFYFNFLVAINGIFEVNKIDYFEITSYIQKVNLMLGQYIIQNVLNGFNIINNFEWVNQYLPYKIFSNHIVNFPPSSIVLNFNLYMIILLSALMTLLHNSFYIYQVQSQNILSSCDMKTYYTPIWYLKKFYNRYNNNFIYIKKIKSMNVKTISKEHINQMINLVFKKDYELYELKISNEIHFYLYHITKIQLILKDDSKLRKLNTQSKPTIIKKDIKQNDTQKLQTNKKPISKREEPNSFN